MASDPATLDPAYWFVFWFVNAGWTLFAAAFLLRKRPPRSASRVRRNQSVWGILLMVAGMGLVWWIRRPPGFALIPWSLVASSIADALACLLTIGSIWLVMAAIRSLGKQWNVRAMVVEEHQLITTGPYALVRHPIYAGMFGMMVATGIAGTYWYLVLAAGVIGYAGMAVRIREEEKLLQETFGSEFEAYRNSVPAIFPWLRLPGRAVNH